MKKDIAVFVGRGQDFAEVWASLGRERKTLRGIFTDESEAGLPDLERLGGVDAALDYLQANPGVQLMYCAVASLPEDVVVQLFRYAEAQGLRFLAVAPVLSRLRRRMQIEEFDTTLMLTPRREPLSRWYNRLLKRTFDLLLSALLLLTLFPVLYVVEAIRRKRQSPGPALVAEQLCGLDGSQFEAYRFRRPEDCDASAVEAWPWLMSVFLGRMSLVGPRPYAPDKAEAYAAVARDYEPRTWARPGLMELSSDTRADDSLESKARKRVETALWYQENWSFWLDLGILCGRKHK